MNESRSPGEFLGAPIRSRTVAGFLLTEFSYAARSDIPRHAHAAPYFSLVMRGAYRERCESKTQECTASSLLFHPAGELHADRFGDASTRIFSIELSRAWIDRIDLHGLALDQRVTYHRAWAVELARRLYRAFRTEDSVTDLAVEGLTMELVAELPRRRGAGQPTARPSWLDTAASLFGGAGRPPKLEDVAHGLGIQPGEIARAFRAHFQCSVAEYARRSRIASACELLTTSTLSLSAVASHTGFADQSHLTRELKRATGVTPARYRRLVS